MTSLWTGFYAKREGSRAGKRNMAVMTEANVPVALLFCVLQLRVW